MQHLDNKTFCAAPWFAMRTNTDRSYSPCCEFMPNLSGFDGKKKYTVDQDTIKQWTQSKYMDYVRKQLLAGNKIPECVKCWKKEDNNIISLRQQINDTLTDNNAKKISNTWIGSFLKKNLKKNMLLLADIKISNLCNYSCVMCNPYDSSIIFTKWHKEKNKNEFVKEILKKDAKYFYEIKNKNKKKYSHDILLEVLKHPIKHLKFLGGEPLLEKKLLTILSNVPDEKKQNISLHFITNGSIDIVGVVKKYNLSFKSVSATVSLEGVGEMQDWARKGSNWKLVNKNIKRAKENGILLTIHHTLQLSTLLRLNQLLDWCNEEKLPITFGYLENPPYLSSCLLPTHLKQNVADIFLKQRANLSKGINSYYEENQTTPENLKKFLLEKIENNNIGNIDRFFKFIEWYEKDSVLKLKNLVPELYK